MNVVGLDLSLTATGVALADGTTETIKVRSRGMERLRELKVAIGARCIVGAEADRRVGCWADVVVIEGYSMGTARQASHAHALGELGGVIRLGFHIHGVRWVDLPPASLKKLATGKGNAHKDEVFGAAIRRLGYTGNSTDEADALWCREAALQHYGISSITLPAAHLEALAKVDWPVLSSGLDETAAL